MAFVIKRTISYKSDQTNTSLTLPAIFTESGLLLSYARFLVRNYHKSASWKDKSSLSVRLLLQYINANGHCFSSSTELLRAFVLALRFGSIDKDGEDNSQLYWSPRKPKVAANILHHITLYCDYVDEVSGEPSPLKNPLVAATKAEVRLAWCAYYNKKKNIFLSHLSTPSPENYQRSRMLKVPVDHLVDIESAVRFPEEKFEAFLKSFTRKVTRTDKGRKITSVEPDYCSQLICLLMHFGGLRISECFHIYTHDVSFDLDKKQVIISVFHPEYGVAPEQNFSSRAEYLRLVYGLMPRNLYTKTSSMHAGWKNPLLSHKNYSFDVYFYPTNVAELFYQILRKYLEVRPSPALGEEHPYLFSNQNGAPETIKNFEAKYRRALRRMNLKQDKSNGLSPHGHRHSYGFRLRNAGFSQLEIQKAMHHKSIDSCLIYIVPTPDEVREKMRTTDA